MQKLLFWSVVTAAIVMFVVLISETILPFFISFILAYLLEPLVRTLNYRYNLPKIIAVYCVFTVFISIVTIFLLIGLPILYEQISFLVAKLPAYNNYLQVKLIPNITEKIDHIDPNIANKIRGSIHEFVNEIIAIIAKTVNNLWAYTMATVNILLVIFLVPIILLYLLRDWSIIIDHIKGLLPLGSKNKISALLYDINQLLATYVRGQLNICGLLIVFYSICLSAIGLDSGLLLGIISGVMIIIPIIGTVFSVTISMIIGYLTFGYSIELSYIIALYVIGHIVEGYIITPKIIGDKIGLHPLWIIFSVLVSGNLLGIVGIFFAIPIAGIVKVLLSYAIDSYKSSIMYKA